MKLITSKEELNKDDHGIIIWLQTGLVWVKGIYFEGETQNSDLLSLLDEVYSELKNDFPVTLYDIADLDEDERDVYIPLNGGEKYILGISHIEEI